MYMEYFFVVVLTVASVLLLGSLTFIAVYVSKYGDENKVFPPVRKQCPDGWTPEGSYCVQPKNGNEMTYSNSRLPATNERYTFGLKSNVKTADGTRPGVDFSNSGWETGTHSKVCRLKNWANSQQITWDGVSNYTGC